MHFRFIRSLAYLFGTRAQVSEQLTDKGSILRWPPLEIAFHISSEVTNVYNFIHLFAYTQQQQPNTLTIDSLGKQDRIAQPNEAKKKNHGSLHNI